MIPFHILNYLFIQVTKAKGFEILDETSLKAVIEAM